MQITKLLGDVVVIEFIGMVITKYEKCQIRKFFWSVFSNIRTNMEIYRVQENIRPGQKKLRNWTLFTHYIMVMLTSFWSCERRGELLADISVKENDGVETSIGKIFISFQANK